MKAFIQIVVAVLCVVATVGLVVLMAISEVNFKDVDFAKCFGLLGIISTIGFIVLTQNDDNEETNPAKEKLKK